jgi:predicted secreted protein
MPLLQHISIRRPHTVGMQRKCGPENEHGHGKGTMDQREKRYMEKIIDYAKKNRTVQRNIGMEKTSEKYQISRRKRTNQDGDKNEEIRRKYENGL